MLYGSEEISGALMPQGKKSDGKIVSPMPGKVIKINVGQGDR